MLTRQFSKAISILSAVAHAMRCMVITVSDVPEGRNMVNLRLSIPGGVRSEGIQIQEQFPVPAGLNKPHTYEQNSDIVTYCFYD